MLTTRLVAPLIAGNAKVFVLTITVQHTARRNNRTVSLFWAFLRATSRISRTHKFGPRPQNGIHKGRNP